MAFRHLMIRTTHVVRTVVKTGVLILITMLFITASVKTSFAGEYVGSLSAQRLSLFSVFSDSPNVYEKILSAKYHLFELGDDIQLLSLTPSFYSRDEKSGTYFSWLFRTFDGKSNGLRIKPILTNGVHISYRLDF